MNMAQTGVPLPHLRAWRMARLWTQAELSQRSGVNHVTISRAENGESVSMATIRRLADALGTDAQTLVNRPPRGGK